MSKQKKQTTESKIQKVKVIMIVLFVLFFLAFLVAWSKPLAGVIAEAVGSDAETVQDIAVSVGLLILGAILLAVGSFISVPFLAVAAVIAGLLLVGADFYKLFKGSSSSPG